MSGTMRSGLLFGAINFLVNLGLGILFPLCAPLCAIVWGAGAGILSVVWTGPNRTQSPAQMGATAGAIAGIGAFLGLLIGGILQFTVLGGQDRAADLSRQLGLPVDPSDPGYAAGQWLGTLGTSCCLSLVTIGVMAGVGAGAAHFYAGSQDKPAGQISSSGF
jgi:hypothetical protein